MSMNKKLIIPTILVSLVAMTNIGCLNPALEEVKDPRLDDISLPDGFHISIYADNIENARSMVMGDKGTLFVGNRSGEKVYAIVDNNNDQIADTQYVIADGLNMPNGVAFKDGSLYIAEVDKIWRIDNIEDHLTDPPQKVLVRGDFPTDKHHGWKYIAFGPDGKLYVPVGAPCNICDNSDKDKRYASITRMNPDGSDFEVYAHGIRNSVGFAWHPTTNELWFTDNGRDMLGDDKPNDELNRAPQIGMHFGYPYCHAGYIPDPEFGEGHSCDNYTPPVAKLNAHTAALGMKFYTGDMFPEAYKGQVFIAEHGSWNRTEPTGYRISLVKLDGNKALGYEPFATGWLKDGKAWGRPVDILQLKDGSLLVSDDFADVIYRITYKK